jgi:hypothetical protein
LREPHTTATAPLGRFTHTFRVAGAHTGAFIGSFVPNSRLGIPGDVFSLLLIGFLFSLPFAVDANWDRIYGRYRSALGDTLR